MANEVIERTWIENRELTFATVERIKGQHQRRIALNRNYLRKTYDLPDVDLAQDPRVDPDQPLQRRGYNLLAEIRDSAAAQICRPMKCSLVPVGGDPKTTANCRTQNRLIDGVMDQVNFLRVATRQYLDGCTTDLGLHMWDWRNGEFTVARGLANQLFWEMDRADTPGALFYEDYIPRRVLFDRYPSKKDAIRDIPRETAPQIDGVDIETRSAGRDVDTVRVIRAEAPTAGSRKGRYVLCAKGVVLTDEEWDYPRTRFVVSRWADDYRGFGGVSMARRLEPYHDRVRFLLRRIDRALRAIVPTIAATEDAAADATFADIDFNKIVWPVGAKEPRIYTPSGLVSADILGQIERDYARAAAEAGASQTLAAGGGPTSLTSGKALREYVAIANQRLVLQMYVWTQIWIDAAETIIMLGDAVFNRAGTYADEKMKPIRYTRKDVAGAEWVEEIKWQGPKALKRQQYQVNMKASSGMSNTTAGKYEDIENLRNLGVITPAITARAMADTMPDVAQIADETNAPLDYADSLISKAADEGKFEPPTSVAGQHLNTVLQKWQSRFLRMCINKERVPKENIGAMVKLGRALQARLGAQPQAPAPLPAPADPNTQVAA